MTELRPCGTEAAYKRHHNKGEKPCRPCMDAHAKYQRENSAYRAHSRARGAALRRLATLYPDVFQLLLAEEVAKERKVMVP